MHLENEVPQYMKIEKGGENSLFRETTDAYININIECTVAEI